MSKDQVLAYLQPSEEIKIAAADNKDEVLKAISGELSAVLEKAQKFANLIDTPVTIETGGFKIGTDNYYATDTTERLRVTQEGRVYLDDFWLPSSMSC